MSRSPQRHFCKGGYSLSRPHWDTATLFNSTTHTLARPYWGGSFCSMWQHPAGSYPNTPKEEEGETTHLSGREQSGHRTTTIQNWNCRPEDRLMNSSMKISIARRLFIWQDACGLKLNNLSEGDCTFPKVWCELVRTKQRSGSAPSMFANPAGNDEAIKSNEPSWEVIALITSLCVNSQYLKSWNENSMLAKSCQFWPTFSQL